MSGDGYRRSGSRGKNVRLFGFNMTMTSALLLFIMAVGLLIIGFYGIYLAIMIWNNTATFPALYFLIYSLIILLGAYILIQTIRFRTQNV